MRSVIQQAQRLQSLRDSWDSVRKLSRVTRVAVRVVSWVDSIRLRSAKSEKGRVAIKKVRPFWVVRKTWVRVWIQSALESFVRPVERMLVETTSRNRAA